MSKFTVSLSEKYYKKYNIIQQEIYFYDSKKRSRQIYTCNIYVYIYIKSSIYPHFSPVEGSSGNRFISHLQLTSANKIKQ